MDISQQRGTPVYGNRTIGQRNEWTVTMSVQDVLAAALIQRAIYQDKIKQWGEKSLDGTRQVIEAEIEEDEFNAGVSYGSNSIQNQRDQAEQKISHYQTKLRQLNPFIVMLRMKPKTDMLELDFDDIVMFGIN